MADNTPAACDGMSDENSAVTCPDCGTPMPNGEPCPKCSTDAAGGFAWGRSRTVFLSLCGMFLIPMFTATGVIVRLFHDKQAKIAVDWENAGNANLQSGHAQTAIEDFRNALLYSSNKSRLQLELAEALAAQGHLEESEDYLSSLRADDPENSLIDLQLARISARGGDVESAVGFYHDAAFGQWPSDPHASRVACRKELINFLLQNGRQDQARAEALSMAADNPADPDIRSAAAAFLFRAGDAQDALNEYQHVLQIEPDDLGALVGGGQSALARGDFAEADRYFARAMQHGSNDAGVQADRELAGQAAELDPFDMRVSDKERRGRAIEILTAADDRAKACVPAVLASPDAAPDNLKPLATARAALPAKLSLPLLDARPEYANQALDWAFSVEKIAPAQCAETVADRAIEALAEKNK
jgi:tetratricopeptide (TPR) repeat protein